LLYLQRKIQRARCIFRTEDTAGPSKEEDTAGLLKIDAAVCISPLYLQKEDAAGLLNIQTSKEFASL